MGLLRRINKRNEKSRTHSSLLQGSNHEKEGNRNFLRGVFIKKNLLTVMDLLSF